jgi:copper(I)-binding protein
MQIQSARPVLLLIASALLLSACVPISPGLSVENPMSFVAAAGDNGGVFLTVVNNGAQADRLVSAESDAAMKVEIHETIDDKGVMRMIHRPEGFAVPAGGRLELKPGGKHIMLMGLKSPLEAGKSVDLVLNFEVQGPVKVTAPIKER